MKVSPPAGTPAELSMPDNVPKLVTAYYAETPDASVPAQRVASGTSGRLGNAFDKVFNEWHILAISQAICLYWKQENIDGPLSLGNDTHALSVPALASSPEVHSALALLAAEITAKLGREPGEIYRDLTRDFGEPAYVRAEVPATPEQKKMLAKLSPEQELTTELSGEPIRSVSTHVPDNGTPIGGLKVIAESCWFAARPSGIENICKIHAVGFRRTDHLRRITEEAQAIVNKALTMGTQQGKSPEKTKVKETP